MITKQQAKQIIEFRNNTCNIQKRNNFYNWIFGQFCDYGKMTKEQILSSRYGDLGTKIKYNPKLNSFEMWALKNTILKSYQGDPNTRTKINSETCLEIDQLPFDKAINIICEICLSLMRNKIHFFIWYAKGQRSPHIRIYDFEELIELNPKQRIKAQILFWRKHVPFGCFCYIDTGMFVDDHEFQMEFATHYKYRTAFELLFEYNPHPEFRNMYIKGGEKIYF